MNYHDHMIEVIQAHKDGAVIQVSHNREGKPSGYWEDDNSITWDFYKNEYRIKPLTRRDLYEGSLHSWKQELITNEYGMQNIAERAIKVLEKDIERLFKNEI